MSDADKLEFAVEAASKLVASELNQLESTVFRIEQRISLHEVIFTLYQHDVKIGEILLKPRVGNVIYGAGYTSASRQRMTVDEMNELQWQPGDEGRDQVFMQIYHRVNRALDFLPSILAVQKPIAVNRQSVSGQRERSKTKPGPKPGGLTEYQKETVRRDQAAQNRGETQKAFCIQEGLDRW